MNFFKALKFQSTTYTIPKDTPLDRRTKPKMKTKKDWSTNKSKQFTKQHWLYLNKLTLSMWNKAFLVSLVF